MTIRKNLFSSLHSLLVRSRHRLRFGLLAILMGGLVVDCQSSPEKNVATQPSATETENCRVVQHDAGETEICGQPQTVAALTPRSLDPLLALDVQPTAYAEVVPLDLRRFDNPSEQIPVLGHRVTTQPINNVGLLLKELGFEMVLPDGLQNSLGSQPRVSSEVIVQLDPDIIIVSTARSDNLYNSESIVKQEWEENPLLQKMRAVQAGRICFASSKRLGNNTSGPIAYKGMLDLLPKQLLPFVEEK